MTTIPLTRYAVLGILLATSVFGQAPARPPRTPIFTSPALSDAVQAITPPPALDSRKMSKDLAEIYAIHRSATVQEIERANWDNQHEDIFAIAKVLGDKMNKESLPATAKLWAGMANDQGIFVSFAKKTFQHPRPYDLDLNIKSICGSKPGGAKNSYPSGHGTAGYLSALVLSVMVPEKAEAIRTRADEYGHNRVVCGDHYAADIAASKEAAGILLGNMMGNSDFKTQLAAAKTEVRQALGL